MKSSRLSRVLAVLVFSTTGFAIGCGPGTSSGDAAGDTVSGDAVMQTDSQSDDVASMDVPAADVPTTSDVQSADTVRTDTGGGDVPFVPTAGATYFCMGYESICMFGGTGRYPTRDACLRAYDSYSMSRALCVANALGMAARDPSHCAGASGMAPCN